MWDKMQLLAREFPPEAARYPFAGKPATVGEVLKAILRGEGMENDPTPIIICDCRRLPSGLICSVRS
jgi:hypothetical protein